jgi:hypothetical protein
MKATIEFNLPEDKYEYDLANKSSSLLSCLMEFEQEIRKIYKYEDLKENQLEIVEKIREKFYEILQDNEINLIK